ncbi:MAG: coproporphyrinogen III oxidase family protein [Burkholderiales bacterium]|nr:coproporphyrinogen III oxidase family protein [Burkholderiales bacterium]
MTGSTETIKTAYKGLERKEKSEAVAPSWMLYTTEKVMQYQLERKLTLDPCVIDTFPSPQPGHQYMMYAHIPFCNTLCSYCTFHRFLFKEYKAREYFISLRKEMESVNALGYDFTSFYIGGGTTTILLDELVKTIELAKKLFPNIKEVSCETDPQAMADPNIKVLKGLVDRMSVGVQSFNDDILKMTDRYQKFGSGEQVFESIMQAQEHFPICNVDLIFGFRGQTDEVLRNDLQKVLQLSPRQITTYPLMVTSQTKRSVKDSIAAPPEIMARQYRIILDTLSKHYTQLSSWAFGKADDEGFDEYVIDNDEYLGIGSGAFSFLGDTLYVNTFSLRRYNQRIRNGLSGVERKRSFKKLDVLKYRLLLGLFSGRLSRKYFRNVHQVEVDTKLFKEVLALKLIGAIKENPQDKNQFIVTDRGKLIGLVMMKDFYSMMDNIRAELRKPLKEADI